VAYENALRSVTLNDTHCGY